MAAPTTGACPAPGPGPGTGGLRIRAAATDRWGGTVEGFFNLTSEAAWASVSSAITAVGASRTFESTWEGSPSVAVECPITLQLTAEGNDRIYFTRWWFEYRYGTHYWRSQDYGFAGDGFVMPPRTWNTLTDEPFWRHFVVGAEIPGTYTGTIYTEYRVEGGELQQTSASWTCSPP